MKVASYLQKIRVVLIAGTLLAPVLISPAVMAVPPPPANSGNQPGTTNTNNPPANSGNQPGTTTLNNSPKVELATRNDLTNLIVHAVQFIAGGVGVILVLMMGWAGFKYLTAGDNPNQVSAAKKHMADIVLALFLYIFGLALLNWLTPGGIFKT